MQVGLALQQVWPLLLLAWRYCRFRGRFWHLGFGPRPAEEFYDLTGDPHQINNLAGNPAYDAIREALREMLLSELRANKDPRLEQDAFDELPYNKKTKPGQRTR